MSLSIQAILLPSPDPRSYRLSREFKSSEGPILTYFPRELWVGYPFAVDLQERTSVIAGRFMVQHAGCHQLGLGASRKADLSKLTKISLCACSCSSTIVIFLSRFLPSLSSTPGSFPERSAIILPHLQLINYEPVTLYCLLFLDSNFSDLNPASAVQDSATECPNRWS